PSSRVYLERDIYLIEELASLDGYDKVPVKTSTRRIMDRHEYRIRKLCADYLVSRGCFDTLNYSFIDPIMMEKLGYKDEAPELQMIRLINPQSSTMSAMRTSLVPQLLQNLAYNLNHGERNIKLFELGKIYHKTKEPMHLSAVLTGQNRDEHWQDKASLVSAAYVKGIIEELFAMYNVQAYTAEQANLPFLSPSESAAYVLNGTPLGFYGKLTASVAENFGIDLIDLKQDVWLLHVFVDNLVEITRNSQIVYTPISRFPAVTRDISFLIGNSIRFSEIEACIKSIDSELIKELSVFDEYRGKQIPEGFRSLSLHIKFQDKEKTLTDERIDQLVDSVIKKLMLTWQINMR
ncbi:MAG: phenylalanine--tRNA ligase subunit beta, partial [Candidatus Cloacimonetes bacterium]|nr:phenylalanine--tRNA ligase subunit beta [Candidatus Cloacimonadota bacterium]